MSSLCEMLLASVDGLFHPDGPVEPQSVKSLQSTKRSLRGHRGPGWNANGFPIQAGNSHQDF